MRRNYTIPLVLTAALGFYDRGYAQNGDSLSEARRFSQELNKEAEARHLEFLSRIDGMIQELRDRQIESTLTGIEKTYRSIGAKLDRLDRSVEGAMRQGQDR